MQTSSGTTHSFPYQVLVKREQAAMLGSKHMSARASSAGFHSVSRFVRSQSFSLVFPCLSWAWTFCCWGWTLPCRACEGWLILGSLGSFVRSRSGWSCSMLTSSVLLGYHYSDYNDSIWMVNSLFPLVIDAHESAAPSSCWLYRDSCLASPWNLPSCSPRSSCSREACPVGRVIPVVSSDVCSYCSADGLFSVSACILFWCNCRSDRTIGEIYYLNYIESPIY